jgi:hypothetical protein
MPWMPGPAQFLPGRNRTRRKPRLPRAACAGADRRRYRTTRDLDHGRIRQSFVAIRPPDPGDPGLSGSRAGKSGRSGRRGEAGGVIEEWVCGIRKANGRAKSQISDWPVQPFAQKYSAARFAQIHFKTLAAPLHRRAFRDRHGEPYDREGVLRTKPAPRTLRIMGASFAPSTLRRNRPM